MNKTFVFIFILNFALALYAAEQPAIVKSYELKDLEVLENERAYLEYFAHAKDVRPSERNKAWNEMTKSMALEMMDQFVTSGSMTDTQYKLLIEISAWHALKNDEFFIKKRDNIVLIYLRNCFQKNPYGSCYKEAIDLITSFPTSDEFGFQLISNIRLDASSGQIKNDLSLTTQYSLWPFAKTLVKNSISEFYCDKPQMLEVIKQHLYSLSLNASKIKIDDILHADCWKVVKPGLVEALTKESDPYSRKITFKILEGHHDLTPEQVYLYTSLQLLSGIKLDPSENILFWDRLKKLGNNYEMREKILSSLNKMIPMPGEVFLGATSQQKLITKAISRYLPEYIDNYATVCLEHLRGEKETPGGNPATRCHELFNLAQSIDLIPKAKNIQYTQLMNSWKK